MEGQDALDVLLTPTRGGAKGVGFATQLSKPETSLTAASGPAKGTTEHLAQLHGMLRACLPGAPGELVQWVNGDEFYEQLGRIVNREPEGSFVVQLRRGHDEERTFQGCRLDEHFVMPRTNTLEGTIDALRATVEYLVAKDSASAVEQEALASSVREQRRQTLDLVGKANKGRAEHSDMKQVVYATNLKLETLQRQHEKSLEYQSRRDGEWRQLVMTNREQRWRMMGLEKESLELKRQLDAEEARRMELEKVVESLNAFRDQASKMVDLEAEVERQRDVIEHSKERHATAVRELRGRHTMDLHEIRARLAMARQEMQEERERNGQDRKRWEGYAITQDRHILTLRTLEEERATHEADRRKWAIRLRAALHPEESELTELELITREEAEGGRGGLEVASAGARTLRTSHYARALTRAAVPASADALMVTVRLFVASFVRCRGLPANISEELLAHLRSEARAANAASTHATRTPRKGRSSKAAGGAASESAAAASPPLTVGELASLLWSVGWSQSEYGRSFCDILNTTLRADQDAEPLRLATQIVRAMNLNSMAHRSLRSCARTHRRQRAPAAAEGSGSAAAAAAAAESAWPAHDETYRGGGLPEQYVKWFAVGRHFRAPALVATSFRRSTATQFTQRAVQGQADGALLPVVWTFHFHADLRCRHVNLIEGPFGPRGAGGPGGPCGSTPSSGSASGGEGASVKDADGELQPLGHEFVFPPYSAFAVREVHAPASPSWTDPIEVHLDVEPDNIDASQDLPLAPWC